MITNIDFKDIIFNAYNINGNPKPFEGADGAFGQVFQGEYNHSRVAIKKLDPSKELNDFINEVNKMRYFILYSLFYFIILVRQYLLMSVLFLEFVSMKVRNILLWNG